MEIRNATSKGNKKYSKLKIDDGTGMLDCFIFDNKDGEPGIRTALKTQHKFPKIDSICAFKGTKYQDMFIVKNCRMQDHRIAMKLSDMENIEDVT